MIAIIACGSDKGKNISEIVTKLGYENEILDMDLCGKKNNFTHYDALILSGPPKAKDIKNIESITDRFSCIRDLDIPILAAGFGHVLIGHLYGSTFKPGESITGPNKIGIVNRGEKLFRSIRKKIFYEEHSSEITLAKDFRLLAYSNSCQNEAMKHVDKDIYSVQFYPELSGSAGVKIIENFLDLSLGK